MIFDVLRETALLCQNVAVNVIQNQVLTPQRLGVKSFGHGPRSFSNLEQENEAMERYGWGIEFPRVWAYPVESVDKFISSGAYLRDYKVMIDIQEQHGMDASSEQLENMLRRMDMLATIFEIRLSKHADFVKFTIDVSRSPIYGYDDAILGGYMLNFGLQVREEIEWPC